MAGLFGDLKADRTPSLFLEDRCALHSVAMWRNILDFRADHIAAAKLTIDGEIEKREVAHLAQHLQPGADGPDMFGLQWRFWPNELALIPWPAGGWRNSFQIQLRKQFDEFSHACR
jgi:hypothetical protein